jgi:integration host factor subunit beta
MQSLPVEHIEESVNLILNEISETLCKGGRVEVRGFGSFSLHYKASRNARNPKTGEKVVTEPKYSAHFKPGKSLRERVNKSRENVIIEGEE